MEFFPALRHRASGLGSTIIYTLSRAPQYQQVATFGLTSGSVITVYWLRHHIKVGTHDVCWSILEHRHRDHVKDG